MGDLLDADLTDKHVAYRLFVTQADEFERLVRERYVTVHGHQPARANLHHVFWRVIDERQHWKTLRRALEMDGGANVPAPGSVADPPVRPPPSGPVPSVPTPPLVGQGPSLGHSRVIPVTTDADGLFAPRMMSDRANAWVSGQHAFVFAGSRATGGPLFFQVDLLTDQVLQLGSKLPYRGETEFWSWTTNGWVMVGEGPRLHRVNPFADGDEVVLDISDVYPNCTLDQWHSSDDGRTHSATVKNGAYQKIATVTMHRGKVDPWPAQGELDESQVSRDGRWVLIKEKRDGWDDNRLINLDSRETRWVGDRDRAVGHSDMGPDYVVGEADKPDPGAMVIRYLDRLHETPRILAHTLNMGYVSTRGGKCLWSNDTHLSLVALDGSWVTPLIEHGANTRPGDPDYYDRRPKASLSPCGRVATFMVDGRVKLFVLP